MIMPSLRGAKRCEQALSVIVQAVKDGVERQKTKSLPSNVAWWMMSGFRSSNTAIGYQAFPHKNVDRRVDNVKQ